MHVVELTQVIKLSFYYHSHFPLSLILLSLTFLSHLLSFTVSLSSIPPFSFFYFLAFWFLSFIFISWVFSSLGLLYAFSHISPYFIWFGFSFVCAATDIGIDFPSYSCLANWNLLYVQASRWNIFLLLSEWVFSLLMFSLVQKLGFPRFSEVCVGCGYFLSLLNFFSFSLWLP